MCSETAHVRQCVEPSLSVGVEGCAREWMSLPGYTEGAVNICEGQRDTAECFSIGVTTICVNELSLCKSTKVS